jgi:hypothetical protein
LLSLYSFGFSNTIDNPHYVIRSAQLEVSREKCKPAKIVKRESQTAWRCGLSNQRPELGCHLASDAGSSGLDGE